MLIGVTQTFPLTFICLEKIQILNFIAIETRTLLGNGVPCDSFKLFKFKNVQIKYQQKTGMFWHDLLSSMYFVTCIYEPPPR